MNKIIYTSLICLLTIISTQEIHAQTNDAFNYQGVVRYSAGEILSNQTIAIKIEILDSTDEVLFAEAHNEIATNPSGIFSLLIGKGEIENNSLLSITDIDWGTENIRLQISLDSDVTDGIDFQLMGVSPLVAVPYALHAETVSNTDDADADPNNELQELNYDPNTNELSLTDGNSVILNGAGGGADADADPNNEIQSLSFDPSTNQISISGSNSVDLRSLGGGNMDDQTLSLQGTTLSIENGNSIDLTALQNDEDADPNNEIQFLSFNATKFMLAGTIPRCASLTRNDGSSAKSK